MNNDLETHAGFSKHDPGYTIGQARYAGRYNGKPQLAVRPVGNGSGFKTRADRLIGDGLNCRWSGRERAYIASPSKVRKFKKLYAEFADASSITGEITLGDLA